MLSPFASMIFKPSEAFMRQNLQREKTSNRKPEEPPNIDLELTASSVRSAPASRRA